MKLTINNTFHQSTVSVIIKDDGKAISLSNNQVKRVERELCGMDCACGSMWSGNHTEIEGHENSHFEPIIENRSGKVIGADLVED